LIRGIGKLDLIENDIVDRLKRDHKPCKNFSKQYMLNVKIKHRFSGKCQLLTESSKKM
jgi:hypothetical protein